MRDAIRLNMNVLLREIPGLVNSIEAISPDRSAAEVAELFSSPVYAEVLSLPLVENGRFVGVISRYHFLDMYLKQFARELHGKRPIRNFINDKPLLVEFDLTLAEAALLVAENMQFSLTEDFIVTRHGKYLGVGLVMNLLKAMESRMRANTDELNEAYLQLKSSQLVQSEKMASLGKMVVGVAHEINAPLGYVQNNVAIGQKLFMQVREMIAGYEALVDNLSNEQTTDEQISVQMRQIAGMRADLNAQEKLGEMQWLMDDSLYGLGQISELVLNLKSFSRTDAIAA